MICLKPLSGLLQSWTCRFIAVSYTHLITCRLFSANLLIFCCTGKSVSGYYDSGCGLYSVKYKNSSKLFFIEYNYCLLYTSSACYYCFHASHRTIIPTAESVYGSFIFIRDVCFCRHDVWTVSYTHLDVYKRQAPSCSRGDRTRFFLKVQDGCD